MKNEQKPDPKEMLMRIIKVAEILAKTEDIVACSASSNATILNAQDSKNIPQPHTSQKTQN